MNIIINIINIINIRLLYYFSGIRPAAAFVVDVLPRKTTVRPLLGPRPFVVLLAARRSAATRPCGRRAF